MASKQTTMPPPGEKPAVIAVGVSKPKAGDGMSDSPDGGDGKVSREEAHFVPADKHCKDCSNYDPASGDCSAVAGSFEPEDACIGEFKAMSDSGEPDADDMGGAPDGDADDSSMPPGMPQ